MNTSLGFQPDPNDDEIFFGPLRSPEKEHPVRRYMTRKTIAPPERGNLTDDENYSEEDCNQSQLERSPTNQSLIEDYDELSPKWDAFENYTSNSNSNVTVLSDEQSLPSDFNLENTIATVRSSISDSVLDSAFIDDGEITNIAITESTENQWNVTKPESSCNASSDFYSFDQKLNTSSKSEFSNVEDNRDIQMRKHGHALQRIENRLQFFRSKFNLPPIETDESFSNSNIDQPNIDEENEFPCGQQTEGDELQFTGSVWRQNHGFHQRNEDIDR